MKNISKKFIASLVGILSLVIFPVVAFAQPATPTITYPATPVTNITTTSVTLNTIVNPNGSATNVWFDIPGVNSNFSSSAIGSGSVNVSVASITLSGLTPNTTYSFSAKAINGNGLANGTSVNFTTAQALTPTITYPGTVATNITPTSATLNAIVNPNGSNTSVWFNVFGINSNFNSQSVGSGNSNVSVISTTLSGLTPNTTYTFRLESINGNGLTNGANVSFTTSPAPTAPLITYPATPVTNITTTSVTLNTIVNPNGSNTSVWFNIPGVNSNFNSQSIGSGNSNVSVISTTLSGLTPNTTYTFRAEALNGIGSALGIYQSFTTAPVGGPTSPVMTTDSTSGITSNSAILNGTFTTGGASSVIVSFTYGLCPANNTNTTATQTFTTSGSYSATITGLTSNTSYCYVANGVGSTGLTGQGGQGTFTTSPTGTNPGVGPSYYNFGPSNSLPTFTTDSASFIGSKTASLNGTYNGNNTDTYTRFAYGTSQDNLNKRTSYSYRGNGSGTFGEIVDNLTPDTTYYFQVEGYNFVGSNTGTVKSFKTEILNPISLAKAPMINSDGATGITSNSAVLNGIFGANGAQTSVRFSYGTSLATMTYHTDYVARTEADGSFSVTIKNLLQNKTYYFKAEGYNSVGSAEGYPMLFQTQMSSNPTAGEFPVTITQSATNITIDSATLNASVTNAYGLITDGYFEYGTSINSLERKTSKQDFGTVAQLSFSADLRDLGENTTYYFRGVSENIAGISKGSIYKFKTKSSSPINNTIVEPAPAPVVPVIDVTPTNDIKALIVSIDTRADKILPGQNVDYFINYKNTASNGVNNVVVRTTLPSNAVYVKSTEGIFDAEDNTVTLNLDTLAPGAEKILFIEARIADGVTTGESLLTTVNANYINNGAMENVLAYSTSIVESASVDQVASVIFGNSGFLPNTIVEWAALGLVIMGLVVLGRKIFLDNQAKKAIASVFNTAPQGLPVEQK